LAQSAPSSPPSTTRLNLHPPPGRPSSYRKVWFKFTVNHRPPRPRTWHGIPRKVQRHAVSAPFLGIVASSLLTGSAAQSLRCRSFRKLVNELVDLIIYYDSSICVLQNRHLCTVLGCASFTPFSSYSIMAFLALAPSRPTLDQDFHAQTSRRQCWLGCCNGAMTRDGQPHCGEETPDRTGAQQLRSPLKFTFGFLRLREIRTCMYILNRRVWIEPGAQYWFLDAQPSLLMLGDVPTAHAGLWRFPGRESCRYPHLPPPCAPP
jgi:hypothetical protein